MELFDYEKKHIDYLKENASECTLFLKRNGEFPLEKPMEVVLVGNGARNTIKGGTGSGDVESRSFLTIEQALINSGFTITSTKWLDEYDEYRKSTKKDYIKDCKKTARKAHIMPVVYSMGYFKEEKDYDIDCSCYEGEACIYVLSRNSGEGNDRRDIKGDVRLSNKEVEDILFLNKKFKKFMLVLNVGGVVDLREVMDVSNILLLSQLGVVTSDVFVDILLGKRNPSGKLATTWAKVEDYPFYQEFGGRDDTYYKEGIYVGYRYFSTFNVSVLFPFGYGLSYTVFETKVLDVYGKKTTVEVKCGVKNVGSISGKEVVMAFISKPSVDIDNPSVELCGYVKTKELKPNESEEVTVSLDFLNVCCYDSARAVKFLPKGDYIIRIGDARDNTPCAKVVINEEIILEELNNKCGDKSLVDLTSPVRKEETNLKEVVLDFSDTKTNKVEYKKDKYVDPLIETLSDDDLAHVCVGYHKNGLAAIVGSSCEHVVGGAGETVLRVKDIKHSLTMADGPAGLRITSEYGIDKKGVFKTTMDPMMEKMLDFLPKLSRPFIVPNKRRKGEMHYQHTTAIPIGTALAQTFNDDFVRGCGELVGREMVMFGVDLWLAPALNIHRNILCGRNFEYYSEDPYLSGKIAIAMIKGVEKDPKLGVTIKHFACNNQEFNRNNNNSHVSERALREIYLKGFELCIKEVQPKAIMTSYNLINGVHTSESFELINDILRCEWGYTGLVMTDWILSGRSFCKKSIYKAPYASNNVKAGNDLTMSGAPKDHKDIMKALKKGKLTRYDLLYSASRIYRAILRQKV